MIVSMSPLCSNVDTAETHSWWAVSPNRLHVRHTKGTVRRKEEEKERKKGGGGSQDSIGLHRAAPHSVAVAVTKLSKPYKAIAMASGSSTGLRLAANSLKALLLGAVSFHVVQRASYSLPFVLCAFPVNRASTSSTSVPLMPSMLVRALLLLLLFLLLLSSLFVPEWI